MMNQLQNFSSSGRKGRHIISRGTEEDGEWWKPLAQGMACGGSSTQVTNPSAAPRRFLGVVSCSDGSTLPTQHPLVSFQRRPEAGQGQDSHPALLWTCSMGMSEAGQRTCLFCRALVLCHNRRQNFAAIHSCLLLPWRRRLCSPPICC